MPKRAPQDWEPWTGSSTPLVSPPRRSKPGRAGYSPRTRGHQLAETRKQLGLAQKDMAAAIGVSIARTPRSNTARRPPSKSSPATSKRSAGTSTWSPTSATGPSGYRQRDHSPPPPEQVPVPGQGIVPRDVVIMTIADLEVSKPSPTRAPTTPPLDFCNRVRKSVTKQATKILKPMRRSRAPARQMVAQSAC